jgi:Fe2+ transport system protein B
LAEQRLALLSSCDGCLVPCVDGAPLARVFCDGDARLVGAAMCPACGCGARWPLAIMLSADRVPVKSTHSKDAMAQVGCPNPRINRHSHYLAVALPNC